MLKVLRTRKIESQISRINTAAESGSENTGYGRQNTEGRRQKAEFRTPNSKTPHSEMVNGERRTMNAKAGTVNDYAEDQHDDEGERRLMGLAADRTPNFKLRTSNPELRSRTMNGERFCYSTPDRLSVNDSELCRGRDAGFL